ncbi:hypothetical protein BDV23DRAFT_148670 [Aspergillus alliaceus]|uniref:Uncharacterized protein n=1 Tax=Petromyces alliaceus TaxID=209559 RepID=A0A5N7CI01_PETAA|nr:hypothetical protein BDV23DRAFT_148670 [Aspergillus alliaceus]
MRTFCSFCSLFLSFTSLFYFQRQSFRPWLTIWKISAFSWRLFTLFRLSISVDAEDIHYHFHIRVGVDILGLRIGCCGCPN